MTYQPFTGGGIPVHAETIVSVFYSDDSFDRNLAAGNINWSSEWDGPRVVAYKVIEEYMEPVKPREWWIVGECEAWDSEAEAIFNAPFGARVIRVREVLE